MLKSHVKTGLSGLNIGSKYVLKEFETQKTQNSAELLKIERSSGYEQINGVTDLALEAIA